MGKQKKIRFNLQEVDGASFSGETVWAEQLEGDQYRLMNIPFDISGYAEGDIVRCEPDEWGEWDEVKEIVLDSGNGTIRLLFGLGPHEEAQQKVLSELVSVGCTYERASEKFVAVTVPPTLDVPFSQLSNFLNGLSGGVLAGWEVAKPMKRLNEKS